jgi:hypothetical protein
MSVAGVAAGADIRTDRRQAPIAPRAIPGKEKPPPLS